MKININDISQKMLSRYSGRYQELGRHIRTLGWGSAEQQKYRFNQTFAHITFGTNKSILDIGCGFGDYLELLLKNELPFSKYEGWDITPEFIAESKQIWNRESKASFIKKNIGNYKAPQPEYDHVVMLGLLNLKQANTETNIEYSKELITNAFSCASETLVVDFLSEQRDPNYPREDFVFYHNPAEMLEFALTLTPSVVLKHDYQPIPQKEFMLFLYK